MESLLKAKNIEISYDPTNKYIYCNWIGFQNKQLIMDSGKAILDQMKKKNVAKVLNDNTQVTGTWAEAAEWTSNVWFPDMIKAGLLHFAGVRSHRFGEVIAECVSDQRFIQPWALQHPVCVGGHSQQRSPMTLAGVIFEFHAIRELGKQAGNHSVQTQANARCDRCAVGKTRGSIRPRFVNLHRKRAVAFGVAHRTGPLTPQNDDGNV